MSNNKIISNLRANSGYRIKIRHYLDRYFVIFMTLSLVFSGTGSVNNSVYAQSNETESPPKDKNNHIDKEKGVRSNGPGQSTDSSYEISDNTCLHNLSALNCPNGTNGKCPEGFVTRGENAECMPEPQKRLIVVDNNTNESDKNNEFKTGKIQSDSSTSKPDHDCLFDPDLPKCAAVNGKCPEGFYQNGYEQCVLRGDVQMNTILSIMMNQDAVFQIQIDAQKE